MRERIIIVFIAIAIGLLVTTLIFFLYQQTKNIPQKNPTPKTVTNDKPTPSQNRLFVNIEAPLDQSISDRRSIQVKGKTNPEATVVISTNQEDEIVKPTGDGAFTASVTIDAGANKIVTRSIAPNGAEVQDVRVITFSTEDF